MQLQYKYISHAADELYTVGWSIVVFGKIVDPVV